MNKTIPGLALALIMVASLANGENTPRCTGSCPAGGICYFGCSELDVRRAVQSANACAGTPVTVYFDYTSNDCPACQNPPYQNCCDWASAGGICPGRPACFVDMTMDSTSDPSNAIASCPGDTAETRTLCITGDNIEFTGDFSLRLQYARARGATPGQVPYAPCVPDPEDQQLSGLLGHAIPQVPPITVRGSNNRILSLDIAYFPQGIRLYSGQNNLLEFIESSRFCDEAIDTKSWYGTQLPPNGLLPAALISGAYLEGDTSGETTQNFDCWDQMAQPARCGVDKGMQINSGSMVITESQFSRIKIPVRLCGRFGTGNCSSPSQGTLRVHGPHSIYHNTFTGLFPNNGACTYPNSCTNANLAPTGEQCRRVCTGIEYGDTGETNIFSGNSVEYCNLGLRVEAKAKVRVENNTFRYNHAAALNVSDTDVRLLAQGNRFVKNACTNAQVTGGNAQVTIGKLSKGDEAVGAPTAVSRLDFGGGATGNKGVFTTTFNCAASNSGAPGYNTECSLGGNEFCHDPTQSKDDVHNTDTSGIGTSFGIGTSVNASCFGNDGTTTAVNGRIVTEQSDAPSGVKGSRCGSLGYMGTGLQNCTPAQLGVSSCDCQ